MRVLCTIVVVVLLTSALFAKNVGFENSLTASNANLTMTHSPPLHQQRDGQPESFSQHKVFSIRSLILHSGDSIEFIGCEDYNNGADAKNMLIAVDDVEDNGITPRRVDTLNAIIL